MDVYLVGGAVRDALLGRPFREKDWVVVGSTPEEMRRRGYRQVGRDFPVFLHPETGEEYALARTERKTGPGHTGFVCHAGPDVSLTDDLRRRDLTINAIAQDARGALVDPFCGRQDLENRLLRHVSDAFVEDPLRVFRVARFAAQLPTFIVAPETLDLMMHMSQDGALAELSAERIWQEVHKALAAPAPKRFFEVLAEAAALSPWLTELESVEFALPRVLTEPEHRFGALAWSLPVRQVAELAARLKAPGRFHRIGEQVARHGGTLAAWEDASAEALLEAVTAVGALSRERDPEPVLTVVEACAECDLTELRHLIDRLRAVESRPFLDQGFTGPAVGEAMREARLERIRTALSDG